MDYHKTSAWFVIVVSLLIIFKILVGHVTTPSHVVAILMMNIPIFMLFYSGIVLFKAKRITRTVKVASVFALIASVGWLTTFIPTFVPIFAILVSMIILISTISCFFIIMWYKWKGAGIVVATIILLVFGALTGSYGASLLESSEKAQVKTSR